MMSQLAELGQRIAIIGCSNSGKSTLAEKLAAKLGVGAVHLDLLAHHPNTNWVRKEDAEFIQLHEAAIMQDSWVMDGNYQVGMPQRFARATSVIWLDMSVWSCAMRFLRRSALNDQARPGRLPGAGREFNFEMLRYILFTYPKNRDYYLQLLENHPKLLQLKIVTMRDLQVYYKLWSLQ